MSISFTAYNDQEVMCRNGHTFFQPVAPDEEFNLNNANAHALLSLLGLEASPFGDISIDMLQCAIDVARATWDDEAAKYVRDEIHEKNFYSFDLDSPALKDRLERFAQYVHLVKRCGATHIQWN